MGRFDIGTFWHWDVLTGNPFTVKMSTHYLTGADADWRQVEGNGLIILGRHNTTHNAEVLYYDSCEGMQACWKYIVLFY